MGKRRTGRPGAGRQVDCGVMVPASTEVHGGAQVSRETPSARDERSYSSKRSGRFTGVVIWSGFRHECIFVHRVHNGVSFSAALHALWTGAKKTVGCSRSSCASASWTPVSAHKVLCHRHTSCRLCHALARQTRCARALAWALWNSLFPTPCKPLCIASISPKHVFGNVSSLSRSRASWCSHTKRW